jgi:hypothetical protein
MNEQIFLPGVKLEALELLPEYKDWLTSWLNTAEDYIEDGNVASSMCLQGILSELALYGSPRTDWLSIMNEYLVDKEGRPIAYSEKYGKRLYRFADWLQVDVHAIYSHWWIDKVCTSPFPQLDIPYGELIEALIQPSGWIYNPTVSPTNLATRMKSEYMMSMVMGLEILRSFDLIKERKEFFEAALSSAPLTMFLSAEHFRLQALRILNSLELAPTNLEGVLTACQLELGYCDFAVALKRDDYMGTVKRTSRDVAVYSPLSSLQAYAIASTLGDEIRATVFDNLMVLGNHLRSNPLDIPAFKIRDLDVPFGSDITPFEVIAASFIVNLNGSD